MNLEPIKTISDCLQNIDVRSLAVSPQALYELSMQCAAWKAFTGEQMSVAKGDWMRAKKKAYETFFLSNEANRSRFEKYGVMAVKDYISGCCGEYESDYEFIERTNNACGYMEDAVRTVISSLKEEMKFQRA